MQTIQFNYITLTEEIKQRLDLVDIVSDHIDLKRKGKRYWGLCPFHAEKTPSFSVSPEKQMFYCFGCGERGDIFTFIMKYHNIDFKAARDLLAARAGIRVNTLSREDHKHIEEARRRREQEKELAGKLQAIIDAEIKRLIMIEKWAQRIIGLIHTPEILDYPVITWAVKHKDEVSFSLDELLRTDDAADQLAIVRRTREAIKWEL